MRDNILNLEDYRKLQDLPWPSWRDITQNLPFIEAECAKQNEPYDRTSAQRLKTLIESLAETVSFPSLGAEQDGMLAVEWIKRDENNQATIMTIICTEQGYVYALLDKGEAIVSGVLNYQKGVAKIFNRLLIEYFYEDAQNAARAKYR